MINSCYLLVECQLNFEANNVCFLFLLYCYKKYDVQNYFVFQYIMHTSIDYLCVLIKQLLICSKEVL